MACTCMCVCVSMNPCSLEEDGGLASLHFHIVQITVTAQLMPGHEMTQPLIMTEHTLEKETEEGRKAIAVISTGC